MSKGPSETRLNQRLGAKALLRILKAQPFEVKHRKKQTIIYSINQTHRGGAEWGGGSGGSLTGEGCGGCGEGI